MVTDDDCWTIGAALVQRRGARSMRVASDRIGELASSGDRAGEEWWRGIAGRMDRLLTVPGRC